MITNRLHIVFCLVFILTSTLNVVAQDNDVKPLGKWILKTNFKMPFPTNNYFFKSVGEGVIDMNGSLNYSFMKNVYVGAGYKYAYHKLDERKLNSSPKDQFNGKITTQGFYGELSYFFDFYENFSIEANFQVGQESVLTSSKFCVSEGKKHIEKGLFYSPNLNFYLKGEEVFSFFLSLGYHFGSNGLQPEDMCIENFSGFNPVDFTHNYQNFTVGFGIGISLVKSSNKL